MTVQSTSQVPFCSLEGKADSLLSHYYQMEAKIYTYEHWLGVSFALHLLEGIVEHSLTWLEQTQKTRLLHKPFPVYLQASVHGYIIKGLSSIGLLISAFSYLIISYKLSNSFSVKAPKTSAKAFSEIPPWQPQLSEIYLLSTFPHSPLATAVVLIISEFGCITQSPTLYKPKTYP